MKAEVRVGAFRPTAQGDQTTAPLPAVLLEAVQVGMAVQGDPGPVVEAGPAQVAIADREAKGLDQVKFGSGGSAGAGHVAGVRWNLGLVEHDAGHPERLSGGGGTG